MPISFPFGGGGGARGFVLGTANNIFGDTGSSGDTDISTVTIAANRTTAEATRDAYDTATAGWLANYTDIDVNILLYYTEGGDPTVQYQRRIGTSWVDNGPPIVAIQGPVGPTGPAGALSIQDEGTPLATDATTLNFVGVGVEATGTTGTKTINVPGLIVQDEGSSLLGEATTLNFTGATVQASGGAAVKTITISSMRTQNQGAELPGDTGTLNFTGQGVTASGTGDIKTVNIPGLEVQEEGVALATDATALNFVGASVTASGTGTTKTITVTAGSGGGTPLTIQDEGTPLATAATTLNFTGVGVTASGDTGTKTINIPAAPSGVTVQDEGTPLTASGTTLNFVGAGVTATGNAATKTISIPGGGSGLTFQDEGTPLATQGTTVNFVGAGVTVTGTGATKTVTIPGVSSGAAIPSLHNFTINIPSRVDIGTDLNNQRTVSFDVSNYSLLTALTLVVTDGDDQTLTLPIRDGVQTQTVTLSGITTTAATTITFQLSGTYSGGTVTSEIQTVTVANLQAQEQAYVGSRLTNDFATVDVATLNAFDVTAAGSVYTFTQSVNNGEFLGILSPTNRDPVSVINTTLNIDDLSRFTATTNVRTIGALSYNLLVLQNNSGFNATFSYRVTTE